MKTKVVKAIVDRLPFVHDPLTIADLAICLYDDQTPQVDRGLRKAVIHQIYKRLPAILNDNVAWQEYSGNQAVTKEVHIYVAQLHMPGQQINANSPVQCPSPPETPTRVKRQRTR